jgi:hypothetical protein
MTFDSATKQGIDKYVTAHLGDEAWHKNYFDFIGDATLGKRLGEEFISTRYIYKVLEGLEAEDWLQRAQIRNQVLSYASIYEAVIHHILFDLLGNHPAVVTLREYPRLIQISIPSASQAALEKHLAHNGKAIIPAYNGVGTTDESKVRFDKKVECALTLGLVQSWLKDELIEFYEARNAIHIHAEIRKSLDYQLDLSKRAYRRMQPFREQMIAGLNALGI